MAHMHHNSIDSNTSIESHISTETVESLSSVLSFTSAEYGIVSGLEADLLIQDAFKIIKVHEKKLQTDHPTAFLDRLLRGMLTHTLSEEGKKHVAIVLHIAAKDMSVPDAVFRVAQTWLECLFYPR